MALLGNNYTSSFAAVLGFGYRSRESSFGAHLASNCVCFAFILGIAVSISSVDILRILCLYW